jgi:hypothetical protein
MLHSFLITLVISFLKIVLLESSETQKKECQQIVDLASSIRRGVVSRTLLNQFQFHHLSHGASAHLTPSGMECMFACLHHKPEICASRGWKSSVCEHHITNS